MDSELMLWLGGFLAAVLLFGAVALYEAGLAPADKPPHLMDLNRNGIPDYREPWFWRGLWRAVSWAVRTFASPDTLAFRAVQHAERFREDVLKSGRNPNP
jgi:hypothetical protein